MSIVVLYCWCHSDSASVLLYFTFLSHLFPLPCGAGNTVPREGFDSSVIMLFLGVLWLWHFLYSVDPNPVSSLHIYTFVVLRAFMAGVASQAGDADSSRAPGLASGFQGSVNVHRGALLLVPQWQCISSFVFYIYNAICFEIVKLMIKWNIIDRIYRKITQKNVYPEQVVLHVFLSLGAQFQSLRCSGLTTVIKQCKRFGMLKRTLQLPTSRDFRTWQFEHPRYFLDNFDLIVHNKSVFAIPREYETYYKRYEPV